MCRCIRGFKEGYQPRKGIVKDEKSDLVTECHSILARWRNHFAQPLNIHEVNDVWHSGIRTVEPLVSELSAFEVEMAVEKLKRLIIMYLPNPSGIIKVWGRIIRSEKLKLVNSILNEE